MFICVGIPLAATSIFYFELLSPSGFYSRKNRKLVHAPTNELVEDESSRHQDSTGREHLKFSFCRTIWLVITILFGSAAHIDSPKGYTARFMVSSRERLTGKGWCDDLDRLNQPLIHCLMSFSPPNGNLPFKLLEQCLGHFCGCFFGSLHSQFGCFHGKATSIVDGSLDWLLTLNLNKHLFKND